jgi:acyl dehydratase
VIQVGDEIPALVRPPLSITQLVMFCGGLRIFDPIHFSREFARAEGFPDAVVNGSMRVAFLAAALTRWQPDAFVTSLRCRHRGLVLLGDEVSTCGVVRAVSADAVEVSLWNETARAGRADEATAVLRPG